MTTDLPLAAYMWISRSATVTGSRVAAFLLGVSLFCWARLTIARQVFPGSPASHDIHLYAAPALAIIVLLAGWQPSQIRANRLIVLGGLIWLMASATATRDEADPVLAICWTAYLALALCVLVARVDRAALSAGMAVGVAASLPVMLFQAAGQTTWPVAAIQGWIGGELTGAVRGAAVLGEGRWLRPYGLMPHPNIAGGVAAVACVLLGAAWLRERRGWQLLAISAAFAETLLSFSRSAWLGAILGLVALALVHRRNLRSLLAAVALPVLLFGASLGGLVLQRAGADGTLEADSLTQRVYLVQTALSLWRQHPLLGIGPAQFSQAEVDRYGTTFIPEPVHNAVFLVLAETGLVGLAGGALVAAGIVGRVARRRDWATLAVGLAILPPLMLDHYLFTSGIGLMLVSAALSASPPPLPVDRFSPSGSRLSRRSLEVNVEVVDVTAVRPTE